MLEIAAFFEHFEERIHLSKGAFAKINDVVGDAAKAKEPGLLPMVVELWVLVAPGNASACGDESDLFTVVADGFEVHPFFSVGACLIFANINAKCSAHESPGF